MRKYLFILMGVSLVFALASCEKTCNCTATQTTTYNDDWFEDIGERTAVTTATSTAKAKKCSDLNSEGKQTSFMGETVSVVECK